MCFQIWALVASPVICDDDIYQIKNQILKLAEIHFHKIMKLLWVLTFLGYNIGMKAGGEKNLAS